MIITLLRKPLEGTVAENTLRHGCGALNIDATRVGVEGGTKRSEQTPYPKKLDGTEDRSGSWARTGHFVVDISAGRWPANFILIHLEGCISQGEDWACVEGCSVKELDKQSGHLKSTTRKPTGNPIYPTSNTSVTWNANNVMDTSQRGFNDEGGASRFFKQFKKENN